MYFNNKLMLFGFETILYFTLLYCILLYCILLYYIHCTLDLKPYVLLFNFNVTEICMMMKVSITFGFINHYLLLCNLLFFM